MNKFLYISLVCFFLGNYTAFCQDDLKNILIANDTVQNKINPLGPAKAAFYSAIVPGLGQVYNKKYWKVPIVYIAIGASVYSYVWNQQKYDNYRDAYKERLLVGDANATDEYVGILSTDRLVDAQKFHQQNKDLSLLVTAAFYILNIIDANVDAHLRQFNVNGKLTVRPEIYQNSIDYKQNFGIAFNYNF